VAPLQRLDPNEHVTLVRSFFAAAVGKVAGLAFILPAVLGLNE
jgi:hypothetical protein